MKIEKTASGKEQIRMSKKEWQAIGKKAGWGKEKWDTHLDMPIQDRVMDWDDNDSQQANSVVCPKCGNKDAVKNFDPNYKAENGIYGTCTCGHKWSI
tara:strand:+ start:43629 stop:43919 length:291 start_codon:yes stop_codon:yes gene_type:complete